MIMSCREFNCRETREKTGLRYQQREVRERKRDVIICDLWQDREQRRER
jgi:hypothetical protein